MFSQGLVQENLTQGDVRGDRVRQFLILEDVCGEITSNQIDGGKTVHGLKESTDDRQRVVMQRVVAEIEERDGESAVGQKREILSRDPAS